MQIIYRGRGEVECRVRVGLVGNVDMGNEVSGMRQRKTSEDEFSPVWGLVLQRAFKYESPHSIMPSHR